MVFGRSKPLPYIPPRSPMIGGLFIIHFSIFSLQFSVYLANEISRRSYGRSEPLPYIIKHLTMTI